MRDYGRAIHVRPIEPFGQHLAERRADRQLRPHAVSSTMMGDGFPQSSVQLIGYTMFDKMRVINCDGSNRYVFEYGYDHQ